MILVIGNKKFSSWSLRPWILLKEAQIPFEEKLIKLDTPAFQSEISKFSAAKKVPVLIDQDVTVWESLAICEYLNEKYPAKQMWPKDLKQRARARAYANEMHAGFADMRKTMSHNVSKKIPGFDWSPVKKDVERIMQIWNECLESSGGPFLFGSFSIVDAIYAPVVNRFETYDVKLTGSLRKYADTMLGLKSLQEWNTAGRAEA